MSLEKKTILVVDDHSMIIHGLHKLIGSQFQVFESAFTGKDAIRKAEELQPDLVIIDYKLPDMMGHTVAKEVKLRSKDSRMIGYSYNDDSDAVTEMFAAGINGYILKDDKDTELLNAVQQVMNGRDYFCGIARDHIINKYAAQNPQFTFRVGDKEFTPREIEIVRMTCKQATAKEIARRLSLSERTIEQYRSAVSKKIGSKNVVGMLKFGLKYGIVKLDDI